MGIFAAEILVPQIVVGIELDERNGAVLFCDGAENGQAYRVIAADANATHAGCEERSNSLLDAEKGVLDGERVHGKIAKVRDAILGEGIHVQDRVPGADDGGLDPDVSRPETRAGAVGCATVKGDTNESDFQLFWPGDVWKAHESRDASETGIAERIERLGMRQAKGAARFRHGEAS